MDWRNSMQIPKMKIQFNWNQNNKDGNECKIEPTEKANLIQIEIQRRNVNSKEKCKFKREIIVNNSFKQFLLKKSLICCRSMPRHFCVEDLIDSRGGGSLNVWWFTFFFCTNNIQQKNYTFNLPTLHNRNVARWRGNISFQNIIISIATEIIP